MSTQPIEWHVHCLKCSHKSLQRKQRELDELAARVAKQREELFHYAAQIAKAKKMGKTKFDEDRFMKKRGTK